MVDFNLEMKDFDVSKVRNLVDERTGRKLTEEQISSAVAIMNGFRLQNGYSQITYKEKVFREGGMTPCSNCGCSDFIRTGTCHTCTNCCTTSGCS